MTNLYYNHYKHNNNNNNDKCILCHIHISGLHGRRHDLRGLREPELLQGP